MLAYLMMGLHTALPVMIGTVMIVATLDFHLGRKQAVLRVIANLAGGVSSVIVLVLLAIYPTPRDVYAAACWPPRCCSACGFLTAIRWPS